MLGTDLKHANLAAEAAKVASVSVNAQVRRWMCHEWLYRTASLDGICSLHPNAYCYFICTFLYIEIYLFFVCEMFFSLFKLFMKYLRPETNYDLWNDDFSHSLIIPLLQFYHLYPYLGQVLWYDWLKWKYDHNHCSVLWWKPCYLGCNNCR